MNMQRRFNQMGRTLVLAVVVLLLLSGCVLTDLSVAATAEMADSTATAEVIEASTFCPEVARPALPLLLPDDSYVLFDPASGESCPINFPNSIPGMVVKAQNDFFVAGRTIGPEGAAIVIRRYRSNGTVEALPYTLNDAHVGIEFVGFTVSDDATLIAWSVLGPTAGSDFYATSLLVADLESGKTVIGVAPETGDAPRALVPIRFSKDGSALYYAHQPYGLGGIWSSYDGRYDNLYVLAVDGSGSHKPIFDCADYDHALCLGDFFVDNNRVAALAYVDRQTNSVVIQNGAGDVLNRLTSKEEYIGYPTWGPNGELVYYSAELATDVSISAVPARGYLHRVAPATAPAETMISNSALLLPIHFVDDTQMVTGWIGENDTRSLALIGIDGSVQILEVPMGAVLVASEYAISPLLGSSGGVVSVP